MIFLGGKKWKTVLPTKMVRKVGVNMSKAGLKIGREIGVDVVRLWGGRPCGGSHREGRLTPYCM